MLSSKAPRHKRPLVPACVLALLAVLATTQHAPALVSSNAGSTIFDGVNINRLVGAEEFYFNGYWGSRAVVANVEAGHIWNGHETLGHVTTFLGPTNDSSPVYDWHATMVGHTIGGRGWLYGATMDGFDFATWFGIAPDATLWSGAIATEFIPQTGQEYTSSFGITDESFLGTYRTVMQTGIGGTRADVINSSWSFGDPAGSAGLTMALDALAYAGRQTVVFAAGNTAGQVGGPASGYNSIAVAAMVADTSTPPYSQLADFSSHGPNAWYNPATGATTPAVRATVDLAAPGDNLTLAFYGGVSGGHISGSDVTGGAGSYYIRDMGGTSFSAPIVAGGAALLVDAGKDRFGGGTSIDGRVVKAVLMNSAAKPAGWQNGQQLVSGVIATTQALDWYTGAGVMDLAKAFHQYTAGTTDVPGSTGGSIEPVGWDYGQLSLGGANDYTVSGTLTAGSRLTITLDWFVRRELDEMDTPLDVRFADMDLEVWRVGGEGDRLVARSASDFSNVEHLSFVLSVDAVYRIRVVYPDDAYNLASLADAEPYALAWATEVPEPATAAMLLGGWMLLCRHRRTCLVLL
jgi:hypothetical protein